MGAFKLPIQRPYRVTYRGKKWEIGAFTKSLGLPDVNGFLRDACHYYHGGRDHYQNSADLLPKQRKRIKTLG